MLREIALEIQSKRRREGEKADATFGFSCLCLSFLYVCVCVCMVQNETLKQKIKDLEEKCRQYFCADCGAHAAGYVCVHAQWITFMDTLFRCSPLCFDIHMAHVAAVHASQRLTDILVNAGMCVNV